MKLCITADLHVGVPNRLDDIIWALKRMRQYCIDHSINTIAILGDLTHDRESLNLRDLCALSEFLDETTKKYGIKIIAFPGNHDMFLKNSWDINSLKPLNKYGEFYHTVNRIELGGRRIWLLPFVYYESKYMEILQKIESKHKEGDVLFTHIGVKSASLNTCFSLKSWSLVDFINSPFEWVFTGHFHSKQQVGKNLWYPGSLIPYKADEGDIDHGFIILDTDTMQHEFISIWAGITPGTEAPPQYLTISDETVITKQSNEIIGNIIRVALSKEHTHNQREDLRAHLISLGAKDVRWLDLSTQEQKESIVLVQAAANPFDMFERYAKADKDNTSDLNMDLLFKLHREIVTEGDTRYESPDEAE